MLRRGVAAAVAVIAAAAVTAIATVSAAAPAPAPATAFPEDHRTLTRTISYAEMEAFLKRVDGTAGIEVTAEGRTAEGRTIYLVHASRGKNPSFRVLFYAQQHGDEVAGKDAALYLLREIARRPERLPDGIDLWILPMMNPDGAERGTRRNAAGADLNRDHILLEQPETQALHRVVRRVRPHLAVDCHEFTRDSEERSKRGWIAWPQITMDGLNNPLFDPAVVAAAERWVRESEAPEAAAGHSFLRYSVGGLPPDEEQRHSAPDIDGGLNAVGMYGGLSFIIEAAVRRGPDAPPDDLAKRVDAYLVLLRRFLDETGHRAQDLAAVEASRRRPPPRFVPTNYLWVNPDFTITEFPALELATGRTVRIPTANMMTKLAVKTALPAPRGYAIEPRAAADYALVLERHGIPFETLAAPKTVGAQRCDLLRLEEQFDDLYSRYEGRQIVQCRPAAAQELPAGALWVPLDGEAAVRAALVLEPAALYGVYQYPRFRRHAVTGEALPIVRVTVP
ncbi:MAG: hypothetical protein MUF27_07300 [Acidobacteria bacterium]|jgi:hypothetical protein|nr:hypothetical protein [Acidobacteriota bacterium]